VLRSKALLIVEFCVFFVAIPLLLGLHTPSIPPIPLLWVLCIYTLIVLLRDSSFQRSELWNPRALGGQVISILLLFAAGAALLTWFAHCYTPLLFFAFVRDHTRIWALLMVLYPILSVYPQGVIYRVFVMHRYRSLLPLDGRKKEWALIGLSACTFSFMHIVFRNPVAVVLTLIGGVIFARRQVRTHSLFVSSFEHALYGCFLFTVGLGDFFYARLI
jgi:uncharacterized protein